MLKKLKDLTDLKRVTPPPPIDNKTNVLEGENRDCKEAGFKDSTDSLGDETALKVSLDAIYAKFQNEEKEDKAKQEGLKEPYRIEKKEIETSIKTTTVGLDNNKEKNEAREKKIEVLKNEIADIPNNPKKYGIDIEKGSSIKFWIGLFLTVPIVIYLFVFYISASYSTFFKQFELGQGTFDSIFDSQAFVKAWEHGALAGMFVTFIPFLFLGLGFLIHMFGENKNIVNYLKITALFIVTFVFDSILAYQIEYKLYELTKTLESPPFDINIAFQEVGFWGIIFAGFVAYIIFGLVFDFVMKEHKERDKIKMAINERNSKIKIEEEAIEKIEDEIQKLKEGIAKYEGRIEELNDIINSIIIPVKEYKLYASQYMQGWIESIQQNFVQKKAKILIEKCKEVYDQHIKEVGANDSQNKIYKKS